MKITIDGKEYDVQLLDDGTLDTVISVNGQECRYSQEFAYFYRDSSGAMTEEGLMDLAIDAVNCGLVDEEEDTD
jgi:hypothetical protein